MSKVPKIKFRAELENIGFDLKSLEDLTNSKLPTDHNPYKPHRLNFFAILFLTSGEVNHSLDFEIQALTKNECLMISKGQVHAFDTHQKYQGFLILFTEDFLIKNLSKYTIDNIFRIYNYPIFSPKYKISHDCLAIFEVLKGEYQKPETPLKTSIIASLLSVFLLKTEAEKDTTNLKATYNHHYDLFNAFKEEIDCFFSQSRNAKFYAEKLNITYKHLNEICKHFSNKSAKEFIDDFIILEIKRQLSSTNHSIKEIASGCGFDEVTNFQKYFKNLTQDTPLSFRQKFQ